MLRYLFLLTFFILHFTFCVLHSTLYSIAGEGGWESGMGGGGYALSSGANAVYINASSIVGSPYSEILLSYSRYYAGLKGESIQNGSLFFAKPFRTWGLGLGGTMFSAGSIYEQYSVLLALSRYLLTPWARRYSISAGLTGKLISVNFPQSGFFEFDINDPIFRKYGTSKSDFTAGAGIRFNYGRLSFGGFVENVKPLNLSLEGRSSGRIPSSFSAGVAYNYRERLALELDVSKAFLETEPLLIRLGAQGYLLHDIFAIRLGTIFFKGGVKSFSSGFTIRTIKRIFLDYAFVIPTGELMSVGGGTHKLSLGMRVAQVPKVRFELGINEQNIRIVPEVFVPNEKGKVYLPIVNKGDLTINGVSAKVYVVAPDGSSELRGTQIIKNLKEGKLTELEYSLDFPSAGWYELRFVVDEENLLKDDDRSDNFASVRVPVFEPPKASQPVVPSGKITVSKISYEKEEYPLVPIFFFARGSSELSTEFDSTIKIIVSRLNDNPDIILKIRGYFDPDGEGMSVDGMRRLAYKRSQRVFERFIAIGAKSEQLVVDTSQYEPSKRRAGSGG
ncbi:MAG: type IX secretion system membrane protein PorP/SprF, partial [bacterium]